MAGCPRDCWRVRNTSTPVALTHRNSARYREPGRKGVGGRSAHGPLVEPRTAASDILGPRLVSRARPDEKERTMTTIVKAGRYEVVGELGRGAMGVVYKATDPVIGRPVAVKTIKLSEEGTGLTRPELLQRFQTEARAAGLLTHPNIVVVYDAGEEDGLYYITMELVEGKSVQALLDDGHAFPLPRVLRIMEQACSALQFAHERNVVHRDIKPANIMLTADDTVKVTDFGTAKILQFGTVQQTTHVMGTPSYMSPEQVKGRAVDGRSDIFSLGVMLYEMITGEKPFPGQSITTVIYKIVNEEPVPPRNINPSIHPGISAAVMKALAKEPHERYQTCRELLEDLRNYRNVAGASVSPQATMMAGGLPSPSATIAIHGGLQGGGLRGLHHPDPAIFGPGRALTASGGNPLQTPGLRRTGPVAPYQEPKKKSFLGTIFAALVLLGVIAYGGYKLRPVYDDVQKLRRLPAGASTDQATSDSATPANEDPRAAQPEPKKAEGESGPAIAAEPLPAANPSAAATATATEVKSTEAVEKTTTSPSKLEPALTPKAAQFKQHIEQAIAERGLAGKAKVQGVNSTLILAGKLHPAEHGSLLKLLRDAPPEVRIVDHIEYDDTPLVAGAVAGDDGHPVPSVGRGAIHVVTDVIGASAVLLGPAGRAINLCLTPCSFNNLVPHQYSLEVKKEGYRPVQTALQVKADTVWDQKLRLESLTKGLFINSEPPGADVFINGAKQSGQTPVTLPLAPGQYNLVLRRQGYDAYSGTVQVKDNLQTQLVTKLTEKSNNRIAWAQVDTSPKGAEIFVDGNPTGKFSPSRVEVPIGLHMITLKLDGYRPLKRTVEASDGGTVTLSESLKPN
jgi:eukaryotic-like serine/threonine-protein kinase